MQNLSKEVLLYIPSSINSLLYIHHFLKTQSNSFGFLANVRKCQKFPSKEFLSSYTFSDQPLFLDSDTGERESEREREKSSSIAQGCIPTPRASCKLELLAAYRQANNGVGSAQTHHGFQDSLHSQ